MECLNSFARDARFNRRLWRTPLRRLMGGLRVILWYLNEGIFRLFLKVATLHDILTLHEEEEES